MTGLRHHKPLAAVLVVLTLSLLFTTPSALAETTESFIQYDANGNRIQDANFHYEYNGFNQLVRIREGGPDGPILEEYLYDHEDNRVMKREPRINQTTYYWSREFITVINSAGEFLYTYYFDGDTLVGRMDPDGKKYFYHPDHLGSTTLITDEAGDVVMEITYEPFGLPTGPSEERFQYTGKELDPGTELYYYGARYYDPRVAQFTQPDTNLPNPYDPQQFNRYSYGRNNPYKYTDPTGNTPTLVTGAVGAVIGGIAGGTISLVTQYTETGQVSWADAGKAAGAGAVAGGVFGLTLGAGAALLGTGTAAGGTSLFAAGAVAGQAGRGTENILEGSDFTQGLGNPGNILLDGGLGVLGGIVAKGLGKVLGKASGNLGDSIPKPGIFSTKIGKFNIPEKILWKFENREFTQNDLVRTIENGMQFSYKHEGLSKIGFYDKERNIFVATHNSDILSIFKPRAGYKYIENLITNSKT